MQPLMALEGQKYASDVTCLLSHFLASLGCRFTMVVTPKHTIQSCNRGNNLWPSKTCPWQGYCTERVLVTLWPHC